MDGGPIMRPTLTSVASALPISSRSVLSDDSAASEVSSVDASEVSGDSADSSAELSVDSEDVSEEVEPQAVRLRSMAAVTAQAVRVFHFFLMYCSFSIS